MLAFVPHQPGHNGLATRNHLALRRWHSGRPPAKLPLPEEAALGAAVKPMPGLACSQERDEDTWDGVLVFPNFGNLGRRALVGVVLDFQPPESAANENIMI